jgi:hypothetical protein
MTRSRLEDASPYNVWLPDPADPAAFDARLAAAGGVDLFLLASGASDGHVGFNPPGTAIDSGSRVVRLAETTRRDNLGTFPAFEELAAVPTHGVSVGLGTIARLSASVVMVLNGAHKQAAALRLLSEAAFTPTGPRPSSMPAATRASPWTSLQLKPGVGAAARDRTSAGALGRWIEQQVASRRSSRPASPLSPTQPGHGQGSDRSCLLSVNGVGRHALEQRAGSCVPGDVHLGADGERGAFGGGDLGLDGLGDTG